MKTNPPLHPIPRQMAHLPLDPRGYPVPWIVQRDKTGRPHFTINDSENVHACAKFKLCGICGKRLRAFKADDPGKFNTTGAWFVSGPGCVFHPHGAFLDPPMHFDCAMYAVRVCPYIANPSYLKRIDDRTLRPEHTPDNFKVAASPLSTDKTPPLFILSQTARYDTFVPSQHRATGQLLWKVRRQDWHTLIPFRAGVALEFDDAVRLHIATHLASLPGVESLQAAGMLLSAVLTNNNSRKE